MSNPRLPVRVKISFLSDLFRMSVGVYYASETGMSFWLSAIVEATGYTDNPPLVSQCPVLKSLPCTYWRNWLQSGRARTLQVRSPPLRDLNHRSRNHRSRNHRSHRVLRIRNRGLRTRRRGWRKERSAVMQICVRHPPLISYDMGYLPNSQQKIRGMWIKIKQQHNDR